MITGNKGEWSEIYALLKIITDKNLYVGDSNLNKIENLILPIVKILRHESKGTFEFSYEDNLVIVKSNLGDYKLPIIEFQNQAYFLLTKLREKTDSTFSIPEIEDFFYTFQSSSLKAKSSSKSDIRIVIHDQRTGTNPELGFSIKSQIGGASTLLNAGKTTNFIYKINGATLTPDQISAINSISSKSKVKDRIKSILSLGCNFQFIKTENPIFENNLALIDSSLPKIIAELLLLNHTENTSKIAELTSILTKINPLGYNFSNNHPFYHYKIKRFLSDIALGMMPSIVWTGELDATGGYLIVKYDGEIVCYHIYNRNEFENYLFYNTKLETASSTRHNFATIYEKDTKLFFKINLQIRFIN